MNRAFWFAAGAGAGIYAMIRGRRAAEALTVEGLRDRMQALGVGARIFREELAQGRAEKESELRERYAAAYDSTPQLPAHRTPADVAELPARTYDEEGSTP
ncbi:DUF6167 family protein [Nocardioides cheoyonin]|uniref:DUF6167 family protein n=1 Tax=Nocardioides cheoyonin TaxID=3156615 RepID=UPI0032B3D9F2